MTKLNFDRDFYVILCDFGERGHSFTETDFDMDTPAKVIAALEEYDNAHSVFWLNPVEGHSRDVSEDIARAWFDNLDVWFTFGEPDPAIPQFIKDNLPDLDQRLAEMRGAV